MGSLELVSAGHWKSHGSDRECDALLIDVLIADEDPELVVRFIGLIGHLANLMTACVGIGQFAPGALALIEPARARICRDLAMTDDTTPDSGRRHVGLLPAG